MSVIDVLAAVAGEVGYIEEPGNRTKYAGPAGHANGQPWCATFLVAMFRQAGVALPSESAYTPTMAAAFRKAGAWYPPGKGRPGDLAFFDFPDAVDRIQHVELVYGISGGAVRTIGGNTSPDALGSQANGGGVYRRTRSERDVVGYGRPNYQTQEVPVPNDPTLPDIDGPVELHLVVAADGTLRGYAIFSPKTGVVHLHGDPAYVKYWGRSEVIS